MCSALIALSSCLSKFNPKVRRPPGTELEGNNIKNQSERKAPSLSPEKEQTYVKQEQIFLIPQKIGTETASLTRPDDDRNFFFLDSTPTKIGKMLTIQVDFNRSNKTKTDKNADKKEKDDDKKNMDSVSQELLSSFPSLGRDDKDPLTLSEFKLKITKELENGDLLGQFSRTSTSNHEAKHIQVLAKIPYHAWTSGKEITTKDLTDVSLVDTSSGEIVERESSHWEDEYTLRLSGFDEAKSRSAVNIATKQNELMRFRDKLKERLVSFGKERQQIAKERDQLVIERDKEKTKAEQLNIENTQQKQKIIDQEQTIKKLEDAARVDQKTNISPATGGAL